MFALNSTVRLVALQFSFSGHYQAASSIRRLNRETQEGHVERKSRSSGVMVIEPIERCSIAAFLRELKVAGYEMVDAFYQERINYKNPDDKTTYHMVRFLFARREFAGISNEFKKVRDIISAELRKLCEIATWRVRAFSNPFFKNGEEISGQRAISINLELPHTVMFGGVGHCLRIRSGVIRLTKA